MTAPDGFLPVPALLEPKGFTGLGPPRRSQKSKKLFPKSLALDFPWLTLNLLASMTRNMKSDPYPLEVHCGPDQTLFVGPPILQLSSILA